MGTLSFRHRTNAIPGNVAADKAAEQALGVPSSEMGIHYEDYKLHIKNDIDRLWQRK